MTYKERLANGDELWRSGKAEVRCSVPADSVVLIVASGHPTPDLTPLFLMEVERRIRRGLRVHWFGDYADVPGYESEVRMALTDFLAKHKDKFESVTVLARHRLLAMGVAVANLAVGGKISVTVDREKFQRVLAATVAREKSAALSAAR
jgi:hypothetical protein